MCYMCYSSEYTDNNIRQDKDGTVQHCNTTFEQAPTPAINNNNNNNNGNNNNNNNNNSYQY